MKTISAQAKFIDLSVKQDSSRDTILEIEFAKFKGQFKFDIKFESSKFSLQGTVS